MGIFSICHWLVVLGIVLLIFGGKKLRSLGSDLGVSIQAFRQSVKDGPVVDGETTKMLERSQEERNVR